MIAPEEFRRVLGHFATGVTVVTTCDGDARPTGFTASAFTSVSLDPPLVLVCVDHKSQTYPQLLERGLFAINILTSNQQSVSRKFASTRLDKFDGVPFRVSPLGLPLIDGALAHIECTTIHTYQAGDHTIFVGEVVHADITEAAPLLYFHGGYRRIG
ncbi:MAG: flavin reductase family protein [Dehalococcoidia bacterium]|nr:flavin reductase family protein [Dehalococcoidia bacterium]